MFACTEMFACNAICHKNLGSVLQAVYAELLRQCFNTYTAVRGTAVSAVMSACKRYPCLAPLGLIIAIRAVAKLPQLSESDMDTWLRGKDAGAEVLDMLQAEVFARRGLPSLPTPTAQSAAGMSSTLCLACSRNCVFLPRLRGAAVYYKHGFAHASQLTVSSSSTIELINCSFSPTC